MPVALWNYNKIYDTWNDMFNEFKRSVSLHIPFSPPYIIVNDPACVEYILATEFEGFVKGKFVSDRLKDVLGGGIFASDGHDWKVQRKTSANIFSVKNFKEFVGTVFVQEFELFSKRLEEASMDGKCIDLQDLFFRFTLDSFGQIGFGVRLSSCIHKFST